MVLSNPELVYDVKCTGQMSLICTFQVKVIVVLDARKTHLRGCNFKIVPNFSQTLRPAGERLGKRIIISLVSHINKLPLWLLRHFKGRTDTAQAPSDKQLTL